MSVVSGGMAARLVVHNLVELARVPLAGAGAPGGVRVGAGGGERPDDERDDGDGEDDAADWAEGEEGGGGKQQGGAAVSGVGGGGNEGARAAAGAARGGWAARIGKLWHEGGAEAETGWHAGEVSGRHRSPAILSALTHF